MVGVGYNKKYEIVSNQASLLLRLQAVAKSKKAYNIGEMLWIAIARFLIIQSLAL